MKEFFRKRVLNPILNLLKQGITPEKLSFSLSAGLAISICPILGTTSTICVIVAYFFRLNYVAIQLANYIGYPLQFMLLIPLLHLGNKIFGQDQMIFNIQEMIIFFQIDAIAFAKNYGLVALRAFVAWLMVAPLMGVVLYYIFLPLIKRIARKKHIPITSENNPS